MPMQIQTQLTLNSSKTLKTPPPIVNVFTRAAYPLKYTDQMLIRCALAAYPFQLHSFSFPLFPGLDPSATYD